MKLKDTKSSSKPSSHGKFQTKGIKVVGKWKEVKIDPNMFADGQMDDLVCFEELTDYQLVSPAKNPSSLFSKEAPKRKAQAVSEEEEEGESSSPKKKIKLKKSKNVATEGTSTQKEFEVKDPELEAQGDGVVCDDPEAGEMASENLVQTAPKKKKNKGKKGLEPSQSTATWILEVRDQKADVSTGKGNSRQGSGKTLAFAIPVIHAVLQWQKRNAAPPPSNTEAPPGETRTEAGAETRSPVKAEAESGALPDDTVIESEALPSDTAAEARAKTGGTISDQALLFGDDDAGEGPSSLIREKPVPKQNENEEKNLDKEQTGNLKQELDDKSTTCKAYPKRPLLGLVLTPTRELAVQVKQHIDAVARFTGIKTAILVGGMSTQKQQRMLNRRPEIVVVVLLFSPSLSNVVEFFSATLTLVHQAPARILHKKHTKKMDKTAKLDLLMQKIGMRGKPKVIDLTRNEATVETLTETKIHCETDEKDFYLYYFLMQYPGRSLVFANSISCIKRLSGLLKVLDIMPLTLHACMHQKQRLRNLEQFARLEDCVLLATDVAARGLDIPKVQHVIHYQVPRTSEIYVHRSGRTARATNEGLSLMLIGPEDVINFKKIYKTLKKDEDIPLFPVQTKYMDVVKERIRLARQIEKSEYRNFQACLHNSWIEQAAAALEIELEEDMYKGGKADQQEERRRQKQMKVLKKELRHLLSQPLFTESQKTKYPTQSGKPPLLVSAPSKSESALSCLSRQKKKTKKPKEPQPEQPQPSTSAN
uniref:ATP-dependent RNA helicase n=1 Tax=Nomascus leucogenys TaxID=61853 RepID=A0A2I3GW64_NOMLE